MDAHKLQSLPLPTPLRTQEPDEPALGGRASPDREEFVEVRTPDNKSGGAELEPVELDPQGLRMHSWARELSSGNIHSAYDWWVCCCPCVALAQLETRLGMTSFGSALAVDLLAYAGRALFLVLALLCLLSSCFGGLAVCLVLCLVCVLWVAHRVARVRVQTRERLEIPGSAQSDRRLGCLHGSRAIRQLAVQLKCDRVHCGAPTTLQAYQV